MVRARARVCVDHMQLCVHSIFLRLHSDTEFHCVQQRVSVRREAGFNRAADRCVWCLVRPAVGKSVVQQGLFGWFAGERENTKLPFLEISAGLPLPHLQPMNLSHGLGRCKGTLVPT